MIIITAYHTGMRVGELLKLKWVHINRKASFIRLPAEITKEKREKNIPINHHASDVARTSNTSKASLAMQVQW